MKEVGNKNTVYLINTADDGRTRPARWPRVQFSWTWTVLQLGLIYCRSTRLGSARWLKRREKKTETEREREKNREWKRRKYSAPTRAVRATFSTDGRTVVLYYSRSRLTSPWPAFCNASAVLRAAMPGLLLPLARISTVCSRTFYIRSLRASLSHAPDTLDDIVRSWHSRNVFFFRGIYERKGRARSFLTGKWATSSNNWQLSKLDMCHILSISIKW